MIYNTLIPRCLAAAALFAALSLVSPAVAATIIFDDPSDTTTLDLLLGPTGESIQVGDLLFEDFTFNASPTTAPPAPSDIVVRGLFALDGTFGIRFEADLENVPAPPAITDFLLGFDVTTLDVNQLIAGVSLNADPVAGSQPDSIAQIVETVRPTGDPIDDSETLVVQDTSGPGGPINSDSVLFDEAQLTITIEKGIQLITPAGSGDVSRITFIEQGFARVPEPTTITLLGGLLAAGVVGRRRITG